MTDLIYVKGAKSDNRVALWDTDAAHPGGEVFIPNDGRVHQVARTAKVERALGAGKLVITSAPKVEVEVKKAAATDSKKGKASTDSGKAAATGTGDGGDGKGTE